MGGPRDGGVHTSPDASSVWSYLHDDASRAAREDVHRAPAAHGYLHWCGRDVVAGDLLHAYVHGSAIALWLDRADDRHRR